MKFKTRLTIQVKCSISIDYNYSCNEHKFTNKPFTLDKRLVSDEVTHLEIRLSNDSRLSSANIEVTL